MNIKKIVSCVVFSFLIGFSNAEVVEKIEVNGLRLVSYDVVSDHLSLGVGQDVEPEDLSAQIADLYETGLFQQIDISIDKGVLVIHCVEQPVIREIEIESSVLAEDQVKKQLGVSGLIKAEMLNEFRLEEFRVGTQYSLRQSGFPKAEVETKVEKLEESVAVIHIIIHEGDSTKLRSIELKGDLKLPKREVRAQIASQTTSMLSFYTMSDLFSEGQLHQDKERLRAFYQRHGYLASSVMLDIETVVPFQRMWTSSYKKAVFTVDPGPKFYIDSLQFDDSEDVWPEEMKEQILSDLNGQVLDYNIGKSLSQILRKHYQDDQFKDFYQIEMKHEITGYDKVQVRLILNKTVSNVRYIYFSGNRTTYDEPLRRALYIEESAPFNASMIRRSEQALRNLGYLKSARIVPVSVDENVYDMRIEVEEASTTTGDGRVQFLGNPELVLSCSDQNAFGTGNAASFSFTASKDSQQIMASYIQPNFTISRHTMSNSVSYSQKTKTSSDLPAYHVNSFNYVLGYSIPMSQYLNLDFAGAVLFDHYHDVETASKQIKDFFANRSNLVEQYKVSGGFSYQDIDNAYMPTSGIDVSSTASVTLPLGEEALSYFQVSSEIIGYYPMGVMYEQPLVLRGRLLGKYITDYSDANADVAFFSRFSAGGIGTVRGYSDLGPTFVDTNHSNRVQPKGGNKLLVSNIELQIPSPLPSLLTPYIFADIGNVFDDRKNISFDEMRGSVGLSVSASLPIGVVTASLAVPFKDQPGDEFSYFSFGFGKMF